MIWHMMGNIVFKLDGEYREYSSDNVINPTFKDLLIIANDIVEYAECWDHHFSEGVEIKGLVAGDIMEIYLFIGS
jgi:hypothetical protein